MIPDDVPDTRRLVKLPNGRSVWMPPNQIRTSTGASFAPLGRRWQQIARVPLPGFQDAADPVVPAPIEGDGMAADATHAVPTARGGRPGRARATAT